jgi:hypothetical protein
MSFLFRLRAFSQHEEKKITISLFENVQRRASGATSETSTLTARLCWSGPSAFPLPHFLSLFFSSASTQETSVYLFGSLPHAAIDNVFSLARLGVQGGTQ